VDLKGSTISMTNNPDGSPTTTTLPSGTGETIAATYDLTGAPSAIDLKKSGSTQAGFSYTYASSGSQPGGGTLSETDTGMPTSGTTFINDATGQGTSSTPSGGTTVTSAPDSSTNLQLLPSGANTTTYNTAQELTSSKLPNTTATVSDNYQPSGQLATESQSGTNTMTASWNGAGQMASYSNRNANMSSATYTGDGQLMSETSTPNGGSAATENFVWDRSQMLTDSNYAYVYDGSGAPIEQITLAGTGAGTSLYLLTDGTGSVRAVSNGSGSVIATTTYDPWGNPPNVALSGIAYSSGTATVTTASANGFSNGQTAYIAGVDPAGYDGAFAITYVDSTHFKYSVNSPGTYVGGGSASGGGLTASTAIGSPGRAIPFRQAWLIWACPPTTRQRA
jgi:YD repeat-containing protein